MKLISLFFVLIMSFISAASFAQEKYGKEIILEESTEISDIISNPEEYVGEQVLIEGEVVSVCRKAGCWMEVANEGGEKIRVKVKDGEIVFPVEAVGKNAVVQGEVYTIELDEEEAKDYLEHMAEDAGKEFDRSSVKGPVTIYQLKGFGAVIN